MSEIKHSESLITNEDTRRRRDFVERAVAGVRGRVAGSDAHSEPGERPPRPTLYVVESRRAR